MTLSVVAIKLAKGRGTAWKLGGSDALYLLLTLSGPRPGSTTPAPSATRLFRRFADLIATGVGDIDMRPL